MYYEDVFRELNKAKVHYLVVGGIAVNLYGIPRTTMDLDLVAELSRENLLKLIEVLRRLGYKPKAPVKAEELAEEDKRMEWVREKNMVAFSFHHSKESYKQVDIILEFSPGFSRLEARKHMVSAKRISIPLIAIEDLIKMKKSSGRGQDLDDVTALRAVKRISGKDSFEEE